jgi:hypothetical protein
LPHPATEQYLSCQACSLIHYTDYTRPAWPFV